MEPALDFMASGAVLYWVIGGVAALVVIYLSYKGHSVTSLFTAPFKWVWNKLTGKKTVPITVNMSGGKKVSLKTVAAEAKQAETWLAKLWSTLGGNSYDPGTHPWTWWIERGAAVVFLWVASLCWMHRHDSFNQPTTYIGSSRVQMVWKSRALKCEADYADLYTREPSAPKTVTCEPGAFVPPLAPMSPPPTRAEGAPPTRAAMTMRGYRTKPTQRTFKAAP